MKNFYTNSQVVGRLFGMNIPKQLLKKLLCLSCLFFSIHLFSQSNHTVTFSNSASDFNALEKISASSGGTDYYITFDQNNLYIGAFNAAGFASTDNLAIYIDTDPQSVINTGNGSISGKLYNGVTPSLPFKADYNVYVEQSAQQANSYTTSWVSSTGPSYSTSANAREVAIPFASMSNPYALNITLWIGNAGSIYSNAPGANVISSATPAFTNYFGTFGIRNGVQGNVNPVNVVSSPATGYISSSGTITGGNYAYVDVKATTTINGLTFAPGGVINVNTGQNLTSSGTINNTALTNNTSSTQINVSGTYILTGRANCSYFNVNNGGIYNHNSAGSTANGVATDWPGINTRTYGVTSNVNILQWALSSADTVAGIPAPTSGGWGNVNFDITKQSYNTIWPLNGAFSNVGGNLILNNIGISNEDNYLTFTDAYYNDTMNIGGNFEMNTPSGNDIYFNFRLYEYALFTLNVGGDFIVTGGHIKFGHKLGKVIVNYWGNYNQTGGEVRAETTSGVTVNAYGVGKYISATYTGGSGTDFNTDDMIFDIKKGANIYLNSPIPLSGSNEGDTTNCIFIVDGTFNCNGNLLSGFGTATFTLSPGGTLEITDANGITNTGTNLGSIQTPIRNFSTQGNYVYNGTSNQITGSGLPATVNSLTINNSNTVSLTNNVIITSWHEIDKGIFSLGAKNVTLYSDVNGTASFNALGTGATITYGTGRYIVERYINSGTGTGQHGKSWQLLSTPASGGTVFNTWQESGIATAGYGTWITDPSWTATNGFDAYSPAPSIKTYNPVSNGWDGISSTKNLIANQIGYFLFVRGDRLATEITSPATPTTLRITGELFTGTQTPVNVPAVSYQTIGNPYASAVNFQSLFSNSVNIDNSFYVWDPSLSGSFGVGGYQTISGTTGYIATPGGSDIYKTSVDYRAIQSGQAIFVHNSSAMNGTVKFTENCKATGSYLVNRIGEITPVKKLFFSNLYTSSGVLADGNAVAFSDSYSDKIDKDDALKISNAGENFGMKRNGVLLAVEARSNITSSDTIFYDMRNLKQQGYRLLFAPKNMPLNFNAFLIDQFLKTEKNISLIDSTFVNFSVTSDTSSSAANRFMIVFRPFTEALAVSFLSLNATRQNNDILLTWDVENENNKKDYGVEHSADGINFSMISTVGATSNISKTTYNYTDNNPFAGNNYYRIQSVDIDGEIMLSPVVKVFMGNLKSSINVYPNPLTGENINLQFVGQPAGNYYVRLLNSAGQLMSSNVLNYGGENSNQIIPLNKSLASGIYQLEIVSPDGEKYVIKVIK